MYLRFIWTPEIEAHLAEHGITVDDYEYAFEHWTEQVKSRSPGIGGGGPRYSSHAMRCYQALDLALMLDVEGHFRYAWGWYSSAGVSVKAQPHSDHRLATAVIEIDLFVQFQPGHI